MDWIIENWRFLVEIFLVFIGIVVTLLKRFKVVRQEDVNPFGLVLEKLPSIIETAEKQFGSGHGSEKLNFVISFAFKIYKSLLGELDINEFALLCTEAIENILKTPTKK